VVRQLGLLEDLCKLHAGLGFGGWDHCSLPTLLSIQLADENSALGADFVPDS
jgi:hypothetical protein